MEQYISKSALVAKIENRIKELQNLYKENEEKLDSIQKTAILLCIEECKMILSILNTLEKEVKNSNDALIKKAVEYLKEHKEDVETEDNGIAGWIPDCFIEKFRNYMEGE